MIGGIDVVVPAKGDSGALDACVRIIREYWPNAVFENAESGDKFSRYPELSFGKLRELLIYPDKDAEKAWDKGDADVCKNSMLYLIRSSDNVTLVTDDPSTPEMQAILDSMRQSLEDLYSQMTYYARAA